MPLFFRQMGPFGYLMIVITIANIVLVLRKAVLIAGGTRDRARLESGLDAILFWGIIAQVLGVLGQLTGVYNALHAIIRATEISPDVVMTGFRESFTTTLYGLWVCVLSAVAWFVLRSIVRRRLASGE
ncbi:MAG: MotA/TolQ/ExbB proton channel family protein [Candidatus Krumholzibacteriota bacterium]|nr:MotA/TolQ/ExbB proton channel family protein [Candidatus Krumholzibacteriota bacterium]